MNNKAFAKKAATKAKKYAKGAKAPKAAKPAKAVMPARFGRGKGSVEDDC